MNQTQNMIMFTLSLSAAASLFGAATFNAGYVSFGGLSDEDAEALHQTLKADFEQIEIAGLSIDSFLAGLSIGWNVITKLVFNPAIYGGFNNFFSESGLPAPIIAWVATWPLLFAIVLIGFDVAHFIRGANKT